MHHFLPEFYLQGFAAREMSQDWIHTLDLSNGRSWKKIPKEIAVQRDFYAAELEGFDFVEMERGLAKVEGWIAPVVKAVRDDLALPSDNLKLDYLINFVATTAVRVPKVRKILAQPLISVSQQILRSMVATPEAFRHHQEYLLAHGMEPLDSYEESKAFVESADYTLDADPATHLQNLILGTERMLTWLANHAWTLTIAAESAPDFVLSDAPVSLIYDAKHWRGVGLSPKNEPTEIVMPLSRRLLLFGLAGRRCVLPNLVADADRVAAFNTFTLSNAERFVYSSDGNITWLDENGAIGNAECLLATIRRDENSSPSASG